MPLSRQETFHIAEYKSLREEIGTKLKGRLEVNRWGLIALAALYSYVLSNNNPVLFWVPVGLSAIMIAHLWTEHRMVERAATYIREHVEPWLAAKGAGEPGGWESFLAPPGVPRVPIWQWSPMPLWMTVFGITVVIAIVGFFGLWP
jgi:hypothetical protein